MPSISVITACYNHGKYIHEMVDSVLSQTFQDFEIIIVNDGSTDDTKLILDEIRHGKIRIIHSEHKGPSQARNLAISNSRSEIIFNLDADDRIAANLFEKAYPIFVTQPNTGIVYTETRYFGARNGMMKLGEYSLERMLKSNQIVSAAFFRKEDWLKCGGYSEDFVYGLEDWDFWLSIIELGKVVVKIHDSCFHYRIFFDAMASRSGKLNSDQRKGWKSRQQIFRRHSRLFLSHPILSNYYSKLHNYNRSAIRTRLSQLIFPYRHKLNCILN